MLFNVPSADWMTLAPLSVAYTVASAKWLMSATKLSPARISINMQFGHWGSMFSPISPALSSDSPVPWP